jgi:Fe2+ or Zn2+ uptake regulation protein
LLEDLYTKFRANTGYKINSIHTTFFGECPHCQADAASEE